MIRSKVQIFMLAFIAGAAVIQGSGEPSTAFGQPPPGPPLQSGGIVSRSSQTTSGLDGGPTVTFLYGHRQEFGQKGLPQDWVNVLGNVTDPDGISSLTYSLNGGSQIPLSIGPDTRRLAGAGDFNIDLSLSVLNAAPDSNIVLVTARDDLSNETVERVAVFAHNATWPLPTTVAWDSYSDVLAAAQVVDGGWYLNGVGLRTEQIGYDRLVAIGDRTWTDYGVLVPITIHSVDPAGYNPTSGCPVVGIFFRWTGHTDDPVTAWQPKSGWNPCGLLGMYAYNTPANGGERLEFWQHATDGSGKTIPLGVTHMFRMSVETRPEGVIYLMKVWDQSEAEPGTWDLTYTDHESVANNGSLLLLAHHVDATFGEVRVGPPGDPLPVQLAGFFGEQVNLTTVRLLWRTLSETENYGFEVERAPRTPEAFSLLAGSFVAGHGTTVVPQEYAYVDSTVGAGVWYYRLRQIDLDGSVHHSDPVRMDLEGVTSTLPDRRPDAFALDQNFPNPFNPSTTIGYTLPSASYVRLSVSTPLGDEVTQLVNAFQGAGYHQVRFDAGNLASGVYFYRITAGRFSQTKALLLVR
jgi:hypothetical protein